MYFGIMLFNTPRSSSARARPSGSQTSCEGVKVCVGIALTAVSVGPAEAEEQNLVTPHAWPRRNLRFRQIRIPFQHAGTR